MSAIAAIFSRDREPVGGGAIEATLRAMLARLDHRGGDGVDSLIEESVALGHVHRWTTPEEVGERQPLLSGDRLLVFDGRLDNRQELIEALGLGAAGDSRSDAALVLAAHEAWGDDCCHRLVGPFAFLLFDRSTGSGLAARDPLGDRTLFYADLGSELVIASEEESALAHPGVSGELDEGRLDAYFAGEVPGDGSTFFSGISELGPGSVLRIGEGSAVEKRFWTPPEPGGTRGSLEESELAEGFRHLLALATRCRLRSAQPAAVLMSGGLDSTSVAALAGGRNTEGGVRAVSWVFDQLGACDESRYIEPVVERLGLAARQVAGDALGPDLSSGDICLNPSSPEENPYRRLKSGAYDVAASWGSTALLSGGSADALYTGFERWARDLASSGRWGTALWELLSDLGRSGARTGLRRAGFRVSNRADPPGWLAADAAERWRERSTAVESESIARVRAVAGPRAARSISLEIFHAARAGVDLRHPYRDLRLVNFMLSLPAYELYRHGRFKVIARRAMAGRLPARVLERTEPTRLTPLFDRAVRGANRSAWEELLLSKDALWPRYVRRDWLTAALERSGGPGADVALWNCIAFELWRRRFSR